MRATRYLLALLAALICTSPLAAQIRVEAIPGRPFGVGKITIPLTAEDANAAQISPRLHLEEADGRVFYPAIERGKLRELVGGLLGGGGDNGLPGQATAWFLFTGDEPLRLSFYTPVAHTAVVTPRAERPRVYERNLTAWWRAYQDAAIERAATGEVPPLFDAYLTTMLAQRLPLPATPLRERRAGNEEVTAPQKTLDLLLGVEKLRAQTLRDTLRGAYARDEAATEALPPDIDWSAIAAEKPPEGVVIEPIAARVPMECFYIRFGKFSNYLWLDNLLQDYGGDLGNMLAMRGQNLRLGERTQKQLCLRKNQLAKFLGDQVIADVALIGRDIYTHEGAAVGMLFQAKNTRLLTNDLNQTRAAIMKEETGRGATEEKIKVAGRDVSFISTPDNRLRSFHAIDGDFHLVTTSRSMVERFFQTGEGKGTLGGTAEFHLARELMPTSRDDTIFVYFSSALFQSLVGPQYQIELSRRLQSVTDIELVYLARLAAQAEGLPSESLDDLSKHGFLPAAFGTRADGSRIALGKDGRMTDSARGARGSYAPIPDMRIEGITRTEAARLAELQAYLRTEWPDMDPIMAGIHRSKLNDKGLERIRIEANASPLNEKKYGWLMAMIGPPVTERVLPVPGDVIHVSAFLQSTPLDPGAAPHHMFLGVQDHAPLGEISSDGLIKMLRLLRTTPGYLGAWPRPGTLDRLPLGIGGTPDEFGFARMPFGLWRRTVGPWSALSFDPSILAHATEHFEVAETDNAAQIRLHVGDIGQTKLAPWVDGLFYERARQTSVGNAALLQHVMQQFHVSPEKAEALVEEVIDGELVCVLGGEYEPAQYRDGATLWRSDAWGDNFERLPADYRAPLLSWFRGLDADLTKRDGRLMVRAQLDMQRLKPEPDLQLPSFNLPNIFGDFGKTSEPKPDQPKIKVPRAEDLPAPKPQGREF